MQETTARTRSSKTPSYADLKKAATAMIPLVEAEADEAEKLTHLTDKLIAEMRRTGLVTLLIPRALGGAELSYVEAMDIIEQMTYADGSAGWCLMVAGVTGASAGAFLPAEGAKMIYPDGADVIMAGQGVPRGFAHPVKGGYNIKGHWSYASGIYHAHWIHTGCFVMDGKEMRKDAKGNPVVVLVHHPKDSIELKGNWEAHGLRASGSYDYTLKGGDQLFVPESTCYPFDNPKQERGGVMYETGLVSSTTWGHTSWALGVGRRALDELAKVARERTDAFGKMHASATFRLAYAQAEAKFRAARAYVYRSWESLSESNAKGDPGSTAQLTDIRLAMRHLHDVISEISTFAHKASRGVSLRPSKLQRAYRDIHAGTQHILLSDEIVTEAGRLLLGVAGPNAKWRMLGVDG